MAAGDFTASVLPKVLMKAEQLWAEGAYQNDLKANVVPATAIKDNQRTTLGRVLRTSKDITVTLTWLKQCDVVDQACTDDCAPVATELESAGQDYTLDTCRESKPFLTKKKVFDDQGWDESEVAAYGLLKSMKTLDEYWAKEIVTQIDANQGTVTYDGPKWSIVGGEGNVTVADTDVGLIPELLILKAKQLMSNPFILSGQLMYADWWTAILNSANADGKGEANRFEAIRKYFDLVHLDTVNSPDLKFYLIDSGAVAFEAKAYYESKNFEHNDTAIFAIESRNIPGVFYDVIVKKGCTSNDFTTTYKVKTQGKVMINPVGCTAGDNGIYTFLQVP